MDYTRNSKNRKIKTDVFAFFSRLAFGTYRLGIAGKFILLCEGALLISLFLPWLTFHTPGADKDVIYGAFSFYLGWIGYGILSSLMCIGFFLLSHEKKERIRAYVPFRLSDAQAIVFVGAMLAVAIVSFTIASFSYTHISSQEVIPGGGLKLAITAIVLLFFGAYFFSQSEKSKSGTFGYLDKNINTHLDEYRSILSSNGDDQDNQKKEKNMSLPI